METVSSASDGDLYLSSELFTAKYFLSNASVLNTPHVCAESGSLPGLELPPRVESSGEPTLSVEECTSKNARNLLNLIGPSTLVTVLQFGEEREVIVSFELWLEHFSSGNERSRQDCASFDVNSTQLGRLIRLPDFVRDLDLCNILYGGNSCTSNSLPTGLLGYHGGACYTAIARLLESSSSYSFQSTIGYGSAEPNASSGRRHPIAFLSMYSSKCSTDFTIAYGGAASFLHIYSGEAEVILVHPSSSNVAKFEHFVQTKSWQSQYFGDLVPHRRVTLRTGASIYIPSGWIYGLLFHRNTIVYGSNFLTPGGFASAMATYGMERRLGVPRRLRFPFFEEILVDCLKMFELVGDDEIRLAGRNQILLEEKGFLALVSSFSALVSVFLSHVDRSSWGDEQWQPFAHILDQEFLNKLQYLQQVSEKKAASNLPKQFAEGLRETWEEIFSQESVTLATLQINRQAQQPSDQNGTIAITHSNLTNRISSSDSRTAASLQPHPSDELQISTHSTELQCPKCLGFFNKKGLGPHRKSCTGQLKQSAQYHWEPKADSHKRTCHRCGNKRGKVIRCQNCPNIFCRRCGEKLKQQHGVDIFEAGCPFCKNLCCCKADKSVPCVLEYHCYKKCHSEAMVAKK